MTINAQNRLLPDWFSRVRTRQTVLPRFQRFEAWGHANVTQMFKEPIKAINGVCLVNATNLLPGRIVVYVK